jgi:hypothetical protein
MAFAPFIALFDTDFFPKQISNAIKAKKTGEVYSLDFACLHLLSIMLNYLLFEDRINFIVLD